MNGWIKVHRKFTDHWLYKTNKPKTYREAWEDMLILVNYEYSKEFIKGQLYDCERGQSLFSLHTWSNKFNWSIQQVRTFFKLLEQEQMITTEGLQYTTRLTVCNYEYYQGQATDEQQTDNTPITDRQQTDNNNKRNKEIKKIRNKENIEFDFKKSLLELGIEKNIVEGWLKVRKEKKGVNTEIAFDKIKSEIEKSGFPANYCIKIAVEKSWVGFNSEWLKNIINNGKTQSNNSEYAARFQQAPSKV